jgi:hypothetical protein
MNVAQAKDTVRQWIEGNLDRWPGLRFAHLVGGITAMRDDAEFPAHKDLDLHLVFDEGSPALDVPGPYPNILEHSYRGLSIEAGVKPVADYASPEVVLANPELAYHFTVDSVLYDPDGILAGLRPAVQRDYRRRRWVRARIEHERRGLAGAFDLLEFAVANWGASGEAMVFGYTMTFAAAVLAVAALRPPKMGGRVMVRLREQLAALDRLDLYDEVLDATLLRDADLPTAERLLCEAAEGFDLAVAVKTTPHPFQHKLHRHLRPYFVEACREMIDEGHHREALGWITPFYTSTCDVILTDGPEHLKPIYAQRQAAFLARFASSSDAARDRRFAAACPVYERIFALAEEIAASHPDVVD